MLHMKVHNISTSDEAVAEDLEEYDWIPMMRYLMYQRNEFLSAHILIFIHSTANNPTKLVAMDNVHYLSPEAQALVFVDLASVQDLLQKSIKDQDVLSPKVHVRG